MQKGFNIYIYRSPLSWWQNTQIKSPSTNNIIVSSTAKSTPPPTQTHTHIYTKTSIYV